MKRASSGVAIIVKREPSAKDLALLQLELSEDEQRRASRVELKGPDALTPPRSRRQQ
jgi:hypothetical protein